MDDHFESPISTTEDPLEIGGLHGELVDPLPPFDDRNASIPESGVGISLPNISDQHVTHATSREKVREVPDKRFESAFFDFLGLIDYDSVMPRQKLEKLASTHIVINFEDDQEITKINGLINEEMLSVMGRLSFSVASDRDMIQNLVHMSSKFPEFTSTLQANALYKIRHHLIEIMIQSRAEQNDDMDTHESIVSIEEFNTELREVVLAQIKDSTKAIQINSEAAEWYRRRGHAYVYFGDIWKAFLDFSVVCELIDDAKSMEYFKKLETKLWSSELSLTEGEITKRKQTIKERKEKVQLAFEERERKKLEFEAARDHGFASEEEEN